MIFTRFNSHDDDGTPFTVSFCGVCNQVAAVSFDLEDLDDKEQQHAIACTGQYQEAS